MFDPLFDRIEGGLPLLRASNSSEALWFRFL